MALLVAVGGCSDGSQGGSSQPGGVVFSKVEVPGGGVPTALAPAGDTLLIGTRRDGQPLIPGMLRRGPDGEVAEIPATGVSPYGLIARWFSIVSDGNRILGIGGENGGAHGNVRWSIWTGQPTAISEKAQAFSTFGSYGAGELTGAVLTPAGPVIMGTWQSANAGYDLATWTADGDSWNRQESRGTPLESTVDELGFPVATTALGRGVLVAGWVLTSKPGSGPTPFVWQSSEGATGWTKATLPDGGHDGAAMSVRCWESVCGIAGRVDGKLAAGQLTDGRWARIPDTPPVPVTDKDHLAEPLQVDGKLTILVSEGGQVKIARHNGPQWTVRTATGPTGTVIATAKVGDTIYLIADQTLWRVDAAALSR